MPEDMHDEIERVIFNMPEDASFLDFTKAIKSYAEILIEREGLSNVDALRCLEGISMLAASIAAGLYTEGFQESGALPAGSKVVPPSAMMAMWAKSSRRTENMSAGFLGRG